MRLTFEFANSTPPFSATLASYQVTPVELTVARRGSLSSQQEALRTYIRSLEYLLSGVINYASGDIISVSLENNWFGKMQKVRDSIFWEAVVDKLFIVLYQISQRGVTEKLYVADAFTVDTQGDKLPRPIVNKALLDPSTKAGRVELNHTIEAIAMATEYVKNYSLAYDEQSGLVIRDRRMGKTVAMPDIDNDEDFAVVCLLAMLLSKGLHHGVFFIDCRGFSDKTLEAFVEIAKRFFGNTFVFVYNCPQDLKFNRTVLELPNFKAS